MTLHGGIGVVLMERGFWWFEEVLINRIFISTSPGVEVRFSIMGVCACVVFLTGPSTNQKVVPALLINFKPKLYESVFSMPLP